MEFVLIFTALVFYISGYIMLKWPPKYPNAFYGYRTPSAMKDEDSWGFAQSYSAQIMKITGVAGLILSVYYIRAGADTDTMGIVIGVYVLLSTILLIGLTEVGIRNLNK